MPEDNVVPLSGKVFRRKRKFQGASWTPPSMSAETPDGAWCPYHKKRHGYKSMLLEIGEKKPDGKFKLLWCCKETKDVLEEM